MQSFNKVLIALMQTRTDEADTLFKQFVSTYLGEASKTRYCKGCGWPNNSSNQCCQSCSLPLQEDDIKPDDKLSGDLDDEDEEPGLTE